jgi:hypothetical protein
MGRTHDLSVPPTVWQVLASSFAGATSTWCNPAKGDIPIAEDTSTGAADIVGRLGVPAGSEAQWLGRQARGPGDESESRHNG